LRIIFVVPVFNAASNLDCLHKSITSQKDDRWSCVLIDDMSSDNTSEKLKSISLYDDRFNVIINAEKKYALRNIVEVSREYQDEDDVIIAVVDGDDSLCNDDTVSLLIKTYENKAEVTWTAHRWDINGMNISREMPLNVNPYFWPWCSSHLRTFKSSLLSNIHDDNFKDPFGKWFKRGYDQALMLPLLYLTEKRVYIDTVCYQYNIDSASIPADEREWSEMEQISTINLVRSRGFIDKQ